MVRPETMATKYVSPHQTHTLFLHSLITQKKINICSRLFATPQVHDVAGNYTCLATNDMGAITSAVAEQFLAIIYLSPSTPSHSPLPTNITWRKPSSTQVIFLQNNAQLRLIAAQLEDAGTYTCVVAGLGERSATLTVRGQRDLVHTCYHMVYCSFHTLVSLQLLFPSSLPPFLPSSLPPPLQKAQ